jgi:hypothetical protein
MVNRKAQVGLVFAVVLLFGSLAWAQTETPKGTPVAPPAAGAKVQNPTPAPMGQPQVVIQATPQAQAKPQASTPPQDPPVMVVAATEFDAGNVNKGDLIKHDFLVENKGKGTLEITHVQPACGCTVTEFDKQIGPGKSGKITATVNTTNFSGPIQKMISVTTNDLKMSNFQLTIKATVKAILNVEPSEYQQFGLVFKGQPLEKVFTIKSEDGSPFQINQINADDPTLKYEVKMAPDNKSAEFKVLLPADHAVGPISGRFTLATTHPKAPTLTIAVYGTIREPLTVYPTELIYTGLSKAFVNEHPEDVSLNKTVTISFEQAADLEIKKVTSSLPFVQATQTAITPNQRYSIQVKIKPPVKEGDFSGNITIDTNKKTIVIPVRGKIF